MSRRLGLVAAWALATGASILVATLAVGAVRGQIMDQPSSLVGAAFSDEASSPATPEATARPAPLPDLSNDQFSEPQPSSTISLPTSTSEPEPLGTSPSTAVLSRTYVLVGGSVHIVYGSGEVLLSAASPRPGFTVDVKEAGPRKVEVEFESEDHESRLRAEIRDGSLKVEIDDEP